MLTTSNTPATDLLETIRELVYRRCGIYLKAEKDQMVLSRVSRRLRALGLDSLGDYLARLESTEGALEIPALLDAITTNKTSFFREAKHFHLLLEQILPAAEREARRKLRLWSAGCSTGEEPLTLAMVLRESVTNWCGWDVRILATDLSRAVLEHARAGIYSEGALSSVPGLLRQKYFQPAGDGREKRYAARSCLQELITWAPLNLVEEWPMSGPFDVIFCRNVMIYFDRPTQSRLISRFEALLGAGGYLFVGHSEGLSGMATGLEYIQPSVYRKPSREAGS